MLLAPKLPSAEVEAEENEVEEEEVEGLLIQRIEPVMHIHITQCTLTTLKVRGEKARDGPINIQFNHFKKYVYYERECKKKQADQNSGQAHISKEEDSSKVMCLSYQETEENCNTNLWLLYSGCNNHMTGNKSQSPFWIPLLS